MDFNTQSFLFVFIPLFFSIFFLFRTSYRKWIILIASVLLYTWFQKFNVLTLLGLILVNYCILWVISKKSAHKILSLVLFVVTLTGDLLFLLFFKVFTTENWLRSNIAANFPNLTIFQKIAFPVGLSFIVFQLLSVLIDSHRSNGNFSGNLWDYLTYIFMFPKITMGPITRFNMIGPQIMNLNPSWDDIQEGSKRFIIGLAKKVIIADQLAVVANAGFGLPKPAFSTSIAWLLIIGFVIQIYYDFSGYIDMGIGLARIMGINFPENFNSPFLSLNVTEFWRRWHMTLISWFRDYLFYPLERQRRKEKFFRQESNIILVFLLTGLWHGLTINYLIWGVLQGILISFENSRFGKWIKGIPEIFQRFYFILMILISWVVFRSESLDYALDFFKRLINVGQKVQPYPYVLTQPIPLINNSVILVLVIGIIGLLPIKSLWSNILDKMHIHNKKTDWIFGLMKFIGYVVVFIITIAFLASHSFVPSIYGRY